MSNYSHDTEPLWWNITKYLLSKIWNVITWLFRTPIPGWGILVFFFVTVFLPLHPLLEFFLAAIAIAGMYYWLLKKPAGRRTLNRLKMKADGNKVKTAFYYLLETHSLYDPENGPRPNIQVKVMDIGYDVLVQTPRGKSDKQIENLKDEIATEFNAVEVNVGRTDTAGDTQFFIILDDPLRTALTDTWEGSTAIRTGPTSVADPVPVAKDSNGDTVRIPLYFSSLLGAGLPRHGKSVALWEILLYMANDPKANIYVVDLKGGVELNAIEPRADKFAVTKEEAYELFEFMMEKMDLRYADMRKKNLRKAPADHPDYQPMILFIDEMAELFVDKKTNDKMQQILLRLISKGPAAGIVVVGFTQRTSMDDIGSVRTRFSYRWSMRLDSESSALMILGNGPIEQGAAPHLLPSANSGGAGLGYLTNEIGDTIRCRSWFIPDEEIDELVSIVAARRNDYLNSPFDAEVNLMNDIDYQEAQDRELAARQEAIIEPKSVPVGTPKPSLFDQKILEIEEFANQLNETDPLAEHMQFPVDTSEPKPTRKRRRRKSSQVAKPVVEEKLKADSAAELGKMSVEELIGQLPLFPTLEDSEDDKNSSK